LAPFIDVEYGFGSPPKSTTSKGSTTKKRSSEILGVINDHFWGKSLNFFGKDLKEVVQKMLAKICPPPCLKFSSGGSASGNNTLQMTNVSVNTRARRNLRFLKKFLGF